MQIEEIKRMLEQTGLPVAYHHFRKQTDPPFIVYFLPQSRNIPADDAVYQEQAILRVELYTALKNPALERKVEAALTGLVWEKQELYIDSEDMYEVIYEMEVMLT